MLKKADHSFATLVITRQRAVTRHVPGDRCVECFKNRGNIALCKVVVRLTDNRRVGQGHNSSLHASNSGPAGPSAATACSACPWLLDHHRTTSPLHSQLRVAQPCLG